MKRLSVVLALACAILYLPASAFAQSVESSDARKVVKRLTPKYPEAARLLQLSGTVRLEALVNPNGEVKTVRVKGGNPVFVQSAQDAVREWKWQKGERETTELIEFTFSPQ
ncbi:MAG: energy transducer TonB [Acidobacteria bacterium]|nr:energy transducer TonB [Acidobacteriota bacterium]